MFFSYRPFTGQDQASNMGNNTPDQEKETKLVKTIWDEEKTVSTNMEANITAPPYEILRDQATSGDGAYFLAHKSLEPTYTFPKDNRFFYKFFYYFSNIVALFLMGCNTYLDVSK